MRLLKPEGWKISKDSLGRDGHGGDVDVDDDVDDDADDDDL